MAVGDDHVLIAVVVEVGEQTVPHDSHGKSQAGPMPVASLTSSKNPAVAVVQRAEILGEVCD